MLDLMWAISNQLACEWADWFSKVENNKQKIRVEKIGNTEKRRNHTFQNIMTETNKIILSTRFRNDYRANAKQHIFYRGKWYLIIGVTENEDEVVPQQAALLGRNVHTEYFLELVEVDFP